MARFLAFPAGVSLAFSWGRVLILTPFATLHPRLLPLPNWLPFCCLQGTKTLGVSAAGPGKFAVALRSAAGYGQVWHGTDRVWRPSYFGEWGVNMTNHSEARARDAAQSSTVLVSEAQFTKGIARWATDANAAGSFIVQGTSQQAAKASIALTASPAETLREPYALSVAARAVGTAECAYITEATAGATQGRLWCSCNLHG